MCFALDRYKGGFCKNTDLTFRRTKSDLSREIDKKERA